MAELTAWVNSGKYLPPIMRDFHAQKDVFKAMHWIVNVEGHDYAKDVSWVAGQCYVIDIFLWFMAKRGYTLQRSRKRLNFYSLADDIASKEAHDLEAMRHWLASGKTQLQEPKP